jgi:excisionase family DNA binding protein
LTTPDTSKILWATANYKTVLEAIMVKTAESATLTIPEACVFLGISRNYGFKLAAQHKFPGARRLGNRWVVSRRVISEFLDGTAVGNDVAL